MKAAPKDKNVLKLSIAEKGMSLRDFSSEIGVSQGYLSQILSGDKIPSAKIAYKISMGLDLEMKSIFFIQVD